ncbi:unnamed protein product [Prorocentrum cordatum]|uniref:Uncharacterized protein n=1 Tax=Prorocentrum cordatum TaxID=2364126 RepID=A0ABN9XXW4_9DINO|nr:unnamed protein product [Polarella glacialis]
MVLGLVQAAHENTLHNKSVSLRLLHDLLPNFSRSQEVRSAPASTQSMVHRMRTVEHASPLHTVGAEESSVQVRRPNNFVEPSRSRDARRPPTVSLSVQPAFSEGRRDSSLSATCLGGASPRPPPSGRHRGARGPLRRPRRPGASPKAGAPLDGPHGPRGAHRGPEEGRCDSQEAPWPPQVVTAQACPSHPPPPSWPPPREEPGRSHHRATAGAPLRARLGRLLAAGARRAGLRHVVAAVLVMSCLMTGASCSVKLFWAHVS